MRAGARIKALVAELGFTSVGGKEWQALRTSLPEVSESTLRKHLLTLGVHIEQPWRGVDTTSIEAVEMTLGEMTCVYEESPKAARDAVIRAKDKARFASRNIRVAAEKRALKSEMVNWMLVWLDDPYMFSGWAGLRRAVLSRQFEISPTKPNPL